MKCLSRLNFRRKQEEAPRTRKFLASKSTNWTEAYPWYLDDSHLDRILTPEMRGYYSSVTGLNGSDLDSHLCGIVGSGM